MYVCSVPVGSCERALAAGVERTSIWGGAFQTVAAQVVMRSKLGVGFRVPGFIDFLPVTTHTDAWECVQALGLRRTQVEIAVPSRPGPEEGSAVLVPQCLFYRILLQNPAREACNVRGIEAWLRASRAWFIEEEAAERGILRVRLPMYEAPEHKALDAALVSVASATRVLGNEVLLVDDTTDLVFSRPLSAAAATARTVIGGRAVFQPPIILYKTTVGDRTAHRRVAEKLRDAGRTRPDETRSSVLMMRHRLFVKGMLVVARDTHDAVEWQAALGSFAKVVLAPDFLYAKIEDLDAHDAFIVPQNLLLHRRVAAPPPMGADFLELNRSRPERARLHVVDQVLWGRVVLSQPRFDMLAHHAATLRAQLASARPVVVVQGFMDPLTSCLDPVACKSAIACVADLTPLANALSFSMVNAHLSVFFVTAPDPRARTETIVVRGASPHARTFWKRLRDCDDLGDVSVRDVELMMAWRDPFVKLDIATRRQWSVPPQMILAALENAPPEADPFQLSEFGRRELAKKSTECSACLVCAEPLRSHRVMLAPCGHSFCWACAADLEQRTYCSMCRVATRHRYMVQQRSQVPWRTDKLAAAVELVRGIVAAAGAAARTRTLVLCFTEFAAGVAGPDLYASLQSESLDVVYASPHMSMRACTDIGRRHVVAVAGVPEDADFVACLERLRRVLFRWPAHVEVVLLAPPVHRTTWDLLLRIFGDAVRVSVLAPEKSPDVAFITDG